MNTAIECGLNEGEARRYCDALEAEGYQIVGAYAGATRSTNANLHALPCACIIVAGEHARAAVWDRFIPGVPVHSEITPATAYGWGAGEVRALGVLIRGEWA